MIMLIYTYTYIRIYTMNLFFPYLIFPVDTNGVDQFPFCDFYLSILFFCL